MYGNVAANGYGGNGSIERSHLCRVGAVGDDNAMRVTGHHVDGQTAQRSRFREEIGHAQVMKRNDCGDQSFKPPGSQVDGGVAHVVGGSLVLNVQHVQFLRQRQVSQGSHIPPMPAVRPGVEVGIGQGQRTAQIAPVARCVWGARQAAGKNRDVVPQGMQRYG